MARRLPFGGKRGYLWVTLALFGVSLAGHWTFAWFEHVDETREHAQEPDPAAWFVETSRGTLENWQSEFLQLAWQVGGLAVLWYVGSPQSKEGDERKEAMLREVLRAVRPDDAARILRDLDERYPQK